MKNKLLAAGAAVIVLIALITGNCSGYRFPDADMEKGADSDRLLGVYLSASHLRKSEEVDVQDIQTMADINQDFSPKDPEAERWYFRRTDDSTSAENVAYETEVPGYAFFPVKVKDQAGMVSTLICSEVISGVHQNIQNQDGMESIFVEGEVFVLPGGPLGTLYFNPVYQTPEGEIYMIPGSGMDISGSLIHGSSISQEINENYTETGKNGAGTAMSSRGQLSGCKLTFYAKEKAESIRLIEFDEDNAVIREESIAPKAVPDKLELSGNTAYLILEEITSSGNERSIFTKKDNYARFYTLREDGLFEAKDAEIEWK